MSVARAVGTDLGVGAVYANGDNEYVFVSRDLKVNRIPVEVSVFGQPTGDVVNIGEVRIKRTDKESWEQDYYNPVSWGAREKIIEAAKKAIVICASPELDRLGKLDRLRVQLEFALEPDRRQRLVDAVTEAQAKVDAHDADIEQMRSDIKQLEKGLTPA